MSSLTTTIKILFTFGIIVPFFAGWIHEATHYVTARVFTQDVEFGTSYRIVATHVSFKDADGVQNHVIRFSCISPLVWVLTVFIVEIPFDSLAEASLYTAVILSGIGVLISPVDILGILFPEAYRQQSKEQSKMSSHDAVSNLVTNLKN